MPARTISDWPGILAHEPLSKHSQFGVGGPADWFVKLRSLEALPELVQLCSNQGIPVTALGAGSNTLIMDAGVRGLVIKFADRKMHVDGDVVTLSAGYLLPRAALDIAAAGLSGMEWGIGVPGICGASVVGNAGAFGGEIKDRLIDCQVVTQDGTVKTMANADCGFAYRNSVLKGSGTLVTEARFRCEPAPSSVVKERVAEIQRLRKSTQPYGVRSLGSTFKNPPGERRAGELLEACGLKGTCIGGAQISEKHANFILNVDSAKAADVLELVRLMAARVADEFDIQLEPEIILVGERAVEGVAR